MPDVYELIREALVTRRQVHPRFDGQPRQLCPHAIGYRGGQPRALFFQFGGHSSRGLEPGGDWRCLALDRLAEVSLRDGAWHTREHSLPSTASTTSISQSWPKRRPGLEDHQSRVHLEEKSPST